MSAAGKKFNRFFSDTWALELLLLLVSWMALLIAVGLLLRADQKPVSTTLGTSLNAMISALGIIFKSAVVFVVSSCLGQWTYISFAQPRRRRRRLFDFVTYDSASRGPLGSLLLLWRTRLSSWAAIGAITIAVSFFIDPFLQQIIGMGEKQTGSAQNPPSIPFATRYDKGTSRPIPSMKSEGILESFPDPSMQAAILSGLSGSRGVQTVDLRCPTAVCEWDAFATLAICSTFADLTSQISKTTGYWPLVYEDAARYQDNYEGEPSTAVQNGTLRDFYALPQDLLHIEATQFDGTHLLSLTTLNRSETISFKDQSAMLWSIAVLQDTANLREKPASSSNASAPPLIAYEISLSICVQNVTSTSRNGTLDESTQNINAPITKGGEPKDMGPQNVNAGMLAQLAVESRDDLEFEGGITITQTSLNGIAAGLDIAFTPTDRIYAFYCKLANRTDTPRSNPPSMEHLYNSPDPKALWDDIAASMTNNMRTNDAQGSLAKGTQGTIVYRVRWAWISLPAAALGGGTVSLVMAMYMTRRYRAPLWKSCALAMLKCGARSADVFEGCEEVSEMEEVAEKSFLSITRAEGK